VLKVLIAEDDLMIADIAEEILIEHGYEVCGIARTVAEAVTLAQQHKPDLAVLDLRLADGGWALRSQPGCFRLVGSACSMPLATYRRSC
jgi:response regulator of citrate/malate metabolism